MGLKLPVPFDDVAMPNQRWGPCGRRVDLESGLRRQNHSRARPDTNRQIERIAGEDARPRTDENHVRRAIDVEAPADPERRLGVGARNRCLPSARLENKLEPRTSPDLTRAAGIG